MGKKIFAEYLGEHCSGNNQEILKAFEEYLKLLQQINQVINLVSRRTSEEDLWLKHFLDSILPISSFDLSNKKILDFGTGGGMPGIPLKIIFPTAEMYLLDSKVKKMEAVKNIIKKLDLSGCFTIVSRLEELDSSLLGFFDLIICRSVKIIPKYKRILLRLLKPEGEILLYKSRELGDVQVFKKHKILDFTHPAIGERKIIKIKKEWEEYE